jgi:hypothetical protein
MKLKWKGMAAPILPISLAAYFMVSKIFRTFSPISLSKTENKHKCQWNGPDRHRRAYAVSEENIVHCLSSSEELIVFGHPPQLANSLDFIFLAKYIFFQSDQCDLPTG